MVPWSHHTTLVVVILHSKRNKMKILRGREDTTVQRNKHLWSETTWFLCVKIMTLMKYCPSMVLLTIRPICELANEWPIYFWNYLSCWPVWFRALLISSFLQNIRAVVRVDYAGQMDEQTDRRTRPRVDAFRLKCTDLIARKLLLFLKVWGSVGHKWGCLLRLISKTIQCVGQSSKTKVDPPAR